MFFTFYIYIFFIFENNASRPPTVGPILPAKFDLDRFRDGGLRPPKLKKNSNFPNVRGGSLARFFLQNLQDICASSVSIILLNLAALFLSIVKLFI